MTRKKIIDPDVIRELADLLSETGLSEIEVENAGNRVRVARPVSPAAVAAPVAAAAAPLPETAPRQEDGQPPGTVPSPMVGTAYLSPEPGAPPFVKVGERINEGQTCIIVEAMKTMNHIPAPRAGTVSAILIEDGQPVEYGQPLLVIE